MPETLTFLHTAPVLVDTFNRLIDEVAPDVPVRHIVDESLLQEARDRGEITPDLSRRVGDLILEAVKQDARVVLCTCSTIGACAEDANRLTDRPVLRVDRPMAEKAVSLGSRIVVAASLESTIPPTRELIIAVAREAKKEIEIVDLLCASAWERLEAGDQKGYVQEVANELKTAASKGDVIVLAQASMAPATDLCPDLPIPVLSSPRLGLAAAVETYKAAKF